MGERELLQKDITAMEEKLTAMKATVATLPAENRISIFKGDFVLGERKRCGSVRVFIVTEATPATAKVVCITSGCIQSRHIHLQTNNSIAGDTCDSNYKYIKVINKEQAMQLI